tara:strand:+ start:100767 stop:101012 length:246 start_codon:yes stop_codon:yes gene_type:complete
VCSRNSCARCTILPWILTMRVFLHGCCCSTITTSNRMTCLTGSLTARGVNWWGRTSVFWIAISTPIYITVMFRFRCGWGGR